MSVLKNGGIYGRQLHKFGGSSLADVTCYRRVAGIMASYSQPGDLMVVSASGNTTNQLINWLKLSQTEPVSAYQAQKNLHDYQYQLIDGLLLPEMAQLLAASFIQDMKFITELLNGRVNDAVYAEVVGHGEIWSARLMAALLNQQGLGASWLDARRFLRAERTAQPQIDTAHSYPLLQKIMAQQGNNRLVITGFISRNGAGETVLLGRNGSDYSATQIGVLAAAKQVTIWSDVAGIYSADPRKVEDAHLLPSLRLDEANELARLSTSVLHTRTLQPVSASNIDLQLRCSYQPEQGSSRIERALTTSNGAKIVTSHDDVCLIELRVTRQNDLLLIQKKIDLLLKQACIRPLFSGVFPDRNLLQLCYTAEVFGNAVAVLIQATLPGTISLREGLTMVALVGAGVCRNPLHTQRFWQHLENYPAELVSGAEKNVSLVAVLQTHSTEHLVRGLHQALFRADKKGLSAHAITTPPLV